MSNLQCLFISSRNYSPRKGGEKTTEETAAVLYDQYCLETTPPEKGVKSTVVWWKNLEEKSYGLETTSPEKGVKSLMKMEIQLATFQLSRNYFPRKGGEKYNFVWQYHRDTAI